MKNDLEVSVHYFKTNFSALVRALEAGEYARIVVLKYKKPIGVFMLSKRGR